MTTLVPTVSALWRREMIKFSRDRSRMIGALLQPLGFWILLGLGFHGTFSLPEPAAHVPYLEFLFPGIVAMILLFTAIFSTISIVEERKSGFLQAALVAPAPRVALVLGNLLGGTTLAVAEAALFLLVLPVLGLNPGVIGILLIVLISTLTGLGFTALGFTIAWRMETTRGFHAVMNLFLLPLWFLSGAPFPVQGAAPVLQWIMQINPVTYAVDGLRQAVYLGGPVPIDAAPIWLCLTITAGFAVGLIALAVHTVSRPLFGTSHGR